MIKKTQSILCVLLISLSGFYVFGENRIPLISGKTLAGMEMTGTITVPHNIDTIDELETYLDNVCYNNIYLNDYSGLFTYVKQLGKLITQPPSDPGEYIRSVKNLQAWCKENPIPENIEDYKKVTQTLQPLKKILLKMKTDLNFIRTQFPESATRSGEINQATGFSDKINTWIDIITTNEEIAEAVNDPIRMLEEFLSVRSVEDNYDFGRGDLSVKGCVQMEPGKSPLDRAIVYTVEYGTEYRYVTSKDGEYKFTGIREGDEITFEVFGVPGLNSFTHSDSSDISVDIPETIEMGGVLSSALWDAVPTRTETFTFTESIEECNFQVPLYAIVLVMLISLQTNEGPVTDFEHLGIGMTTISRVDHFDSGPRDCVIEFEEMELNPYSQGPFYFGAITHIEVDGPVDTAYIGVIKAILEICYWLEYGENYDESMLSMVPLPHTTFERSTPDGGAGVVNLLPGEYTMKIQHYADYKYLYREVKMKIDPGVVTNASPRQGAQCLSKLYPEEVELVEDHFDHILAYWGFNDRRDRSDPKETTDSNADNDILYDFSKNKYHSTITKGEWVELTEDDDEYYYDDDEDYPYSEGTNEFGDMDDGQVEDNEGGKGCAIDFDKTAYIQTPLAISESVKDITIELWVKPDEIIGIYNHNGQRFDVLSTIDNDGNINPLLYFEYYELNNSTVECNWIISTSDVSPFSTGIPVEFGKWQHLVITFSGSGPQTNITLYKNFRNEQKVGWQQQSSRENVYFANYNEKLIIGSNFTAIDDNNYYYGLIDGVAVYNTILAEEDIIDHYNSISINNNVTGFDKVSIINQIVPVILQYFTEDDE